ncbi:MAG: hypothetical protein AAF984_08665 [Verrucomicrobiota bacterium]
MELCDIPALARFEKHAKEYQDCSITQSCLTRVKELIEAVPPPSQLLPTENNTDTMIIRGLRESCQAVEESTRIIWACAACTSQINPLLWDYNPDFNEALIYFRTLSDLDFMALTKEYRLSWEIKQ